MKKLFAMLFVLLFASMSFADDNGDSIVHWKSLVGVITAPSVDNPVAGISSGTLPWTTAGGRASVNLDTGDASFFVDGLVLNGGNATGTTGPVQQVVGTLVCNPGTTAQAILDTPTVPLDQQGNADFRGSVGTVPFNCANPLFLIRISNPGQPPSRWLATGAGRVIRHPKF
jgi:hypothetical protein